MSLHVVPEGLAAVSSGVEAVAARLAAAEAQAATLITAVVPPAVDPVSLQGAAQLSVHGTAHAATAVQGVTELNRAATGVAESGASYAVGDAAGASAFLAAGH